MRPAALPGRPRLLVGMVHLAPLPGSPRWAGSLDAVVAAAVADARALAEGGFSEPSQMGLAMKAAMAKVAGKADGKAVSALVKARLSGG